MVGRSNRYAATQLRLDEPFVQRPVDAPGVLLRVRPYDGTWYYGDTARLFGSIHDLRTTFWGKNKSDHHAFEVWSHKGRIEFYFHVATAEVGKTVSRQVASSYENSEVDRIESGPAFPAIDPDDYVTGVRLELALSSVFPIRHHEAEGFNEDPYERITREMETREDSAVVVQVVFRPAKPSWAQRSLFTPDGVADYAHGRRQGTSVGWWDPHIRSAGDREKEAADFIDAQRGRPAFHVNVRVLAVSPDEREAAGRARGVAGLFDTHYDSITDQGFEQVPITSRSKRLHVRCLRRHVDRMADRVWIDREQILTVDELAAIAHVPNGDVETSSIDRRGARRGQSVDAGAERASFTSLAATSSDETPTEAGGPDEN